MQLTVATFNVNNLFSRSNFFAEVDRASGTDAAAIEATTTFSSDDSMKFRLRTFEGRLVGRWSPLLPHRAHPVAWRAD